MKEKIFLFVIFLFAFLLRFYGIWRNLPFGLNPDEPLLMREALRFGQNLNIGEFVKSAPFMILNFAILSFYYIFGKAIGIFHSPEDIAVKFVRDPAVLYFIIRGVSAILSTLSIFLIGILLYRFFRKKEVFLWSVLIFSLLPASVLTGRVMKEDNLAIFLFLIAVLYLYTLYENGGTKRFFIAGFLVGIAVAGKGYSIFLYPILLLSWWQTDKRLNSVISSLAGILLGNSLANPYPYFNLEKNITVTFLGPILPFFLNLLDLHTPDEVFRYAKIAGGLGWKMGVGIKEIGNAIENGTGWLFAILSIVAFFYAIIKRKNGKILPSLLFILLYSISLFLSPQCFPHYFLPLIPYLFILLFGMLQEWRNIYRSIILALLTFSFLFISLKGVLPYVRGTPTEKLALEWIKNNIPPDKKILIDQ